MSFDEDIIEGLQMRPEKETRKSVSIETVSNGFVVSKESQPNFKRLRAVAKSKAESRKIAKRFLNS